MGDSTRPAIEKGLVYSPSYGATEFTVPHFRDFLQRRFPLAHE